MLRAGDGKQIEGRQEPSFCPPSLLEAAASMRRDATVLALLKSKPLRRLRAVSFLGAIDHLPPGAGGQKRPPLINRLEHSIGVATLAWLYGLRKALPPDRRRLITVAALLHDVGHLPLSHSLEPLFRERFGIDHHLLTRQAIMGNGPFGDSIRNILESVEISPAAVVDVLEGADEAFDRFFSGAINFDTVDAITRLDTHNGPETLVRAWTIIEAAAFGQGPQAIQTVDDFWMCKNAVYARFIYHDEGRMADEILRHTLRRLKAQWNRQAVTMTDDELQHSLGLRFTEILRKYDDRTIGQDVPYREFFVVKSAMFADRRRDRERYRSRWIKRGQGYSHGHLREGNSEHSQKHSGRAG